MCFTIIVVEKPFGYLEYRLEYLYADFYFFYVATLLKMLKP